MINLDELLYSAYMLGVETEQGTPALNQSQLRSILLRNVPMLGKTEITETPAKKSAAVAPVAEKKPRKQSSAAGKPRAIPEDETRCHARSFYEKDHIENGALKIVREDEVNQFGDRCKFKKTGESEFCKHHSEKQPHGVWGGDYDGKFKLYLGKPAIVATESSSDAVESTPVKKTIKKTAPVAPKKSLVKVEEIEEEEEVDEEADEDEVAENLDGGSLDDTGVQYDWIEIEDEQYMIDSQGNVYDPENEKKIGKYDTKKKSWISGGIKA
jgi:hypothetical protein